MTDQFYPPGLPGTKTEINDSQRKVLISGGDLLPGGIIVDGSESRDLGNTSDTDTIRAGKLMGKVTSGGRYAPSIIGTLAIAYDDSSTGSTILLTAAQATELVRRVGSTGTITVVGPPSAAGVVASESKAYTGVNTSTGVVTLASDLASDFIAGSFVMAADGSEAPLGLLAAPVKVNDSSDNDIDVPANLLIGGHVALNGILDWPTDTSLETWIKSKLNGGDGTSPTQGKFTFAEDYAAA